VTLHAPQIRLDDPTQYQSIVDAEWNIIYEKLAKCVESGANIVLSRLAIGDLATQYFADRNIFCAGRVSAGGREAGSVRAQGASPLELL
jgi:T-complex protein 1 subunit eta